MNDFSINGVIRGCMQSQNHKRLLLPAPLSMKQCCLEKYSYTENLVNTNGLVKVL